MPTLGIDMRDRYGIWAKDMGDDNIDMVISHIDMAYLVTQMESAHHVIRLGSNQGLTLVHFSAQPQPSAVLSLTPPTDTEYPTKRAYVER